MKTIRVPRLTFPCIVVACMFPPCVSVAQTTEISTEYLMTIHIPTDLPQEIDAGSVIYNFLGGGWVDGPKIKGKLVTPGADWVQILPSGSSQLDVRSTIKTDDDALIYLHYSGIFSASEKAFERLSRGEVLTSDDLYCISTPTFRTSAVHLVESCSVCGQGRRGQGRRRWVHKVRHFRREVVGSISAKCTRSAT